MIVSDVTVTWDQAAIKVNSGDRSSPVGRAMERIADSLVLSMKYRCPVYKGPERGPRPGHPRQAARPSGTLRSSIRKLPAEDGGWIVGPTDRVGPPTSRAVFLGPLIEQGTEPHDIDSTGPWPLHNAATGTTFGPRVHHPGTAAQPFIGPATQDLNGLTIRIS